MVSKFRVGVNFGVQPSACEHWRIRTYRKIFLLNWHEFNTVGTDGRVNKRCGFHHWGEHTAHGQFRVKSAGGRYLRPIRRSKAWKRGSECSGSKAGRIRTHGLKALYKSFRARPWLNLSPRDPDRPRRFPGPLEPPGRFVRSARIFAASSCIPNNA